MPKNFKVLFDAMPPERRMAIEERSRKTLEKMALREARRTQEPKRSKVSEPKASSSPQAKC